MPNHVTNHLTFGPDADAIAAFQKMLKEVRDSGKSLGTFDFNKLIPMPPSLNIERSSLTDEGLKLYQAYAQELAQAGPVGENLVKRKWAVQRRNDPMAWALGEQAYQNVQKYGYPTWYEWANQNWGTKWNAYQCKPLSKSDDTMIFLTAWGAVPNIVATLSRKYPAQTITYRWADENIGYNVGEAVFRGGECVGLNVPEEGSPAAYEMTAEILGIDLSEFHQRHPAAKKNMKGNRSKER